tara:strand:+ start:166 stop:1224 length:1059 start_codon:yes stop_codon:yes gene_type:complete
MNNTVLKLHNKEVKDNKLRHISEIISVNKLDLLNTQKIKVTKESYSKGFNLFMKVRDLFIDEDFQRLVRINWVKSRKEFKPHLIRPIYVMRRPDGSHSTVDGQHSAIIAVLYTVDGYNTYLPIQLLEHNNMTNEECKIFESKRFIELNDEKSNVKGVDKLRAGIAYKNEDAIQTENVLKLLKLKVENIGDPDGLSVSGYNKLMQAYNTYGLPNVDNAIRLYKKHREDAKATKWKDDKDYLGSLIGGLSAVYYLLNGKPSDKIGALGDGDKRYALITYLENFLKNVTPVGNKDRALTFNTAGNKEAVLIARKIISQCNICMEQKYITKKNGDEIKEDIGETVLTEAGLGDPSK